VVTNHTCLHITTHQRIYDWSRRCMMSFPPGLKNMRQCTLHHKAKLIRIKQLQTSQFTTKLETYNSSANTWQKTLNCTILILNSNTNCWLNANWFMMTLIVYNYIPLCLFCHYLSKWLSSQWTSESMILEGRVTSTISSGLVLKKS